MALKTILILTAGFGEGHNAAARNLRDAITTRHPDADVSLVDIFDLAYGPINRLAQRNYLFLINHAPGLWNIVFKWLDRTPVVGKHIGVFGRAAKILRKMMEEKQPDIVVSTYPGYNHLLDHIHRTMPDRKDIQVTIVTDSITVNSVWLSGHSDWLLVANDATADVIKSMGTPPEKVRVSGFPVPPFFSELRHQKSPPPPGEKWKVLFMVNSGKRTAVDVLRALAGVRDIELTLTVGRDDALMNRLERTAKEVGLSVRFFGWTEQMPKLVADSHIVISKAGGATVQECLAAESPMLISQVVPGQEEGNARLIVESGAGKMAETPDAIVRALDEAFADGGKVWQSWYQGSEKLSRPNASNDIADWLIQLPPR